MSNKQIPASCTIQQYRAEYATPGLYRQLSRWNRWCYGACVIGVLLGLMLNPLEIFVCAGLLAAAQIGVGKRRRKSCAMALAIGGAVMLPLVMLSGLIWLVCGIGMLSVFRKIDAEYKELKANLTA